MKKLLFLFISLQFSTQVFSQNTTQSIKKLEKDIQKAIQQAYRSSVYITSYDSVTQTAGAEQFTGVVVDTAGHILSAAHAIRQNDVYSTLFSDQKKEPNLYEVTFPDGRKFRAVGLGKIASNDAAMLKITDKGTWPYAEMGWSSSLQKDMPCISIAYPGTLRIKKPTVRLGYIAEPRTRDGFIRSTCLMEPGDSGGPLFDMKGRVIGLHSRVDLSLDANYEVPVNLYRKYWTALNSPVDYDALPAAENFTADPRSSMLKPMPEIKNINAGLQEIEAVLDKTVMVVKSTNKGTEMLIRGTLVDLKGIVSDGKLKNKSFIISKSSMVGDDPMIKTETGKNIKAMVLSRDEANDLVLLQLDSIIKGGVKLKSVRTDTVGFEEIGKFLISPQPDNGNIISVLGNTQFGVAGVPDPPFIGFDTSLEDGKLMISKISPGSPASTANLDDGDELVSFNGTPMQKPEDLIKVMAGSKVLDTVNIQYNRGRSPFKARLVLVSKKPPVPSHIAFHFTDGRSERADGFDHVLVHDGRLKPAECGGPLYDTDGRFYGINIARFSRTSSLAIPAIIVSKFVEILNFNLVK